MIDRHLIPRRRHGLLPLLGLAHVGLVVMLGSSRPVLPDALPVAVIASYAVQEPSPPAEEPSYVLDPVEPSLIAPVITLAAEPDSPPAATALHAAPPGGGPCRLDEVVAAALRTDPRVGPALAGIPRDARSVAGAVMLWDGRWVRPVGRTSSAALTTIRGLIVASVRAAPQDCRSRVVTGPQLIPVATEGGTIIVVLGSGAWRWSDLVDDG